MVKLENYEIKNIYDSCLAELSYWSQLDNCYKKLENNTRLSAGLTTLFVTKLGIPLEDLLSNLTTLYHYMFFDADYLPSVFKIPDNIQVIDGIPFVNISNLQKLIIPETVTTIQGGVVAHCSNLTKIELPAAATSVTDQTFVGCNSLKTIVISPNCKNITINSSAPVSSDAAYYLQSANTKLEVEGNWHSEEEKDEWVKAHIKAAY